MEQVAEPVLRPSVHDAVDDLVRVGAQVNVVSDARCDNRENIPDALAAVVEPGEKPVASGNSPRSTS
jgi:hypothetical protein